MPCGGEGGELAHTTRQRDRWTAYCHAISHVQMIAGVNADSETSCICLGLGEDGESAGAMRRGWQRRR